MKRFVGIIFATFLLALPAFGAQYKAAMVADMDSGKILYQENATVQNYPWNTGGCTWMTI